MTNLTTPSRRTFLVGSAAAALTAFGVNPVAAQTKLDRNAELQAYIKMYAALPQERFPLPAVNLKRIEPQYLRRFGEYKTDERPGTIIVDTQQKVLFLTMPNGKAIRYGIGVGRAGFSWSGRAMIKYKKAWPTWTPPSEMITRQPELEEWRQGMPPGIENPLGARALYIFQDGRDTLYRLHGTNDPASIGKAVSSGCVRLLQHDVIDLFNRVPNNSPIVVL